MAEQPSSAWISGGSAATTSVSGAAAASSASAVEVAADQPPPQGPIPSNSSSSQSAAGSEPGAAVQSPSQNSPLHPRGGHSSRKRGQPEGSRSSSREESGGKRPRRTSSSPASSKRRASRSSTAERGRPRGRGSVSGGGGGHSGRGSALSSTSLAAGPRHQRASPRAHSSSTHASKVDSKSSRGGVAASTSGSSSSVDPVANSNSFDRSARGRRAVTAASTAATASAAASAAAAAAARGKTNQRGRPSTRQVVLPLSVPSTLSSQLSSRKRGLAHSSAASSLNALANSAASASSLRPPTASPSSSSTSASAVQPPFKKYPLRNQVRLLPGSQEPVPLDVIRPPPEYYPPSHLGHTRRSLGATSTSSNSRVLASSRSTRSSLASRASLTASGSSSVAAAIAGEKRARTSPQHTSPVLSLRRSSRSKTTTGSCASSSGRRTSRGGTKPPLASSSPSGSSAAPGPSSSSSAGASAPPLAATSSSTSVIVSSSAGHSLAGVTAAMAESGGWEGLAEASAAAAAASSTSSVRGTPPPLPPPLLLSSSSSSAAPTLLAAAMTTSGGGGQQLAASASSVAAAAAAAAAAADSESDDSEVGLSCTSTSMLLQPNSSSAAAAAASSGSSSQLLARTASSVGRLQALLEARGLPPHLFGALGPRMQHLLHRSIGGSGAGGAGSSSKVQQLLQGLTATNDEGAQLTAVIEMCQMLVMGNEDTLAGFPVKQVVPALITLLSMEHNFDMMNHACRALTYMMEALPRSSAVVVDAVPVFLEKLQVIQCMDVAEQSLTALEMLSRRHGKAILQARGVSSCLTYLDFFSINAQRAALATTANCCMNLHPDEFHLVSESLPLLASRLTQQDKRSMESVCLAFSRLVDSFQLDPVRLRAVASAELLANLQRLLVVTPQVVSTGTFITVLRMLSVMCANCPALARDLLRHNIADTLLFLLTGNAVSVSNNEEVELVSRSPQELYEITCLIGELMPRLPTDGLFSVDALLERTPPMAQDAVTWQWRDDRELWHPYSTMDSRIIEAAHQAGEDEISLSTLGRTYTIDFHSMQQINEDTGTTRSVHRRVLPTGLGGVRSPSGQVQTEQGQNEEADSEEERQMAAGFIRSLFSVLYEVYSSSAGPAVRCKCLRALLRMVHFATADLLKEVLRNQVVSSHLAGMLASADLRIVVGALQMAYILMQKLPVEFGVHFRREGVMHQIQRLADTPLPQTPGPSSAQGSPANGALSLPQLPTHSSVARSLLMADSSVPDNADDRSSSPHVRVLADVLKRKRTTPKRGPTSSSRKTRQDESSGSTSSSMAARDFFRAASFGAGSASSSRSGTPTAGASSGPASFSSSSSSTTPSSGAGRSRFSGAKSSFLASLNPARWGRSTTAVGTTAATSTTTALNGQGPELRHKWWRVQDSPLSKSCSAGGLAAGNKEKARAWVREQAQRFVELYFSSEASGPPHPALSVLSRLTQAIERLRTQPWQGEAALRELRDIVLTSDISPFEVNHSGLISALLQYLTAESVPEPVNNNNEEESSATPEQSTGSTALETKQSIAAAATPTREHKLRIFLHIFAGCPRDSHWLQLPEQPGTQQTAALSALVAKLGGCVAQLEQFPVKVHDLPSGASGSGRGGGTSALKFFNTHQLKCNLQRHPLCNSLRQWKGGTVKIDPLALVQAIERYLVVRGYGRLRDKDSADSDDETEEDIDDTLAAVVISQGSARHKLQFLIGEQPLPYNMTVYQAVRQYGASASAAAAAGTDQSETDTDSEAPLAHAGLWVQTHTIYYRPAPEEESANSAATVPTVVAASSSTSTPAAVPHHSGRKGKGSSSKSNSRRKGQRVRTSAVPVSAASDGQVRVPACPLVPFLKPRLPDNVTVQDASLDVLCLQRVLHALSRHWGSLYAVPHYRPLLPQQEFVSTKISAKASRQLQDPLVIMTGNLPAWLQQVASACPFLFPFETRQLLFYATSFDRDRALQRLLEASPELNSAEAHERVTPRLDRRKRVVSRSDILRQAEQVVQDLAASRALLEVQYENEVGTGLGPTLEFYALVSHELQRADLELWLGETVPGGLDRQTHYVHAPQGLFPSPLAKNAKVVQVARIKAKFRFLGRLMAKAVMDSRLLDLPLSHALYRTLLSEGPMLSLPDLSHVSPAVHSTLARLLPLARQYASIEADPNLSPTQKKEAQEALLLDGAPVSAIELDFTLPGHPQVELRKGGRDITVTIHNLDSYIKLVCHWFLSEGVSKQMESLRDGFEAVFPLEHLRLFYPEELEAVFCGAAGACSWDVRTLMECCRPDHGYTPDSRAIRFLFEILASYNSEEQRQFLQFITGSPKLPVGGFKSLNPPLTVVRKTLEPNMDPDDFLPSVMTCVNYLKLPDYSSIDVMRAKLRTAAQEGQHSFHLS